MSQLPVDRVVCSLSLVGITTAAFGRNSWLGSEAPKQRMFSSEPIRLEGISPDSVRSPDR